MNEHFKFVLDQLEAYGLNELELDESAFDIFEKIWDREIAEALYESANVNIDLSVILRLLEHADSINSEVYSHSCDYCGDTIYEIESDCAAREILDISSDSCNGSYYCSDEDLTFCNEDCHDRWHDNNDDDDEEDESDEEYENEDEDESSEENEGETQETNESSSALLNGTGVSSSTDIDSLANQLRDMLR